MISADTVLNIINENGMDILKSILPEKAYELIKKKYDKEPGELIYLKELVKKYEKKNKAIKKVEDRYEIEIDPNIGKGSKKKQMTEK